MVSGSTPVLVSSCVFRASVSASTSFEILASLTHLDLIVDTSRVLVMYVSKGTRVKGGLPSTPIGTPQSKRPT